MEADRVEPTEGRVPLPTLLSRVLVAFAIEFDNEFERRMPHRTTNHGSTPGATNSPWLVSLVMWSNCMQFVGEAGVTVGELERRAHTKTNLAGMERWGYVVVAPDPADPRPKPPRSQWVVRATRAGRQAQDVWQPLFSEIELRWRTRFGADAIDQLRESLRAVVSQLEIELPDCLPILGYGLFSNNTPHSEWRAPAGRSDATRSRLPLSALLAKALLAFALDFERVSEVSLAVCADVLRLVGAGGVRLRELPRLAGVSKEAISMALSYLEKRGYAVIAADPSEGRVKILQLTAQGRAARAAYHRRVGEIERGWQDRFGADTVGQLRMSLEQLVGDPATEDQPLMRGLDPPPDGWRAAVATPEVLPHFPMVLHRGGFPDGS